MASINRVVLSGNLTRDPILRKTPGGHSVCDMRLAVSERFRTASGEPQERTLFIDVSAWERQADNCAKYLAKGSSVIIDGRLRQDEYKTKDGETRVKVEVVAQNVQFLNTPGRDAAPSASSAHSPAFAPASAPPQDGGADDDGGGDDPPF